MGVPRIRVLDLETTGFKAPEHVPIEIGAQDLVAFRTDLAGDPVDWTLGGEAFAALVRPDRDIPPESSAVHHLTGEDFQGIAVDSWKSAAERALGGEAGSDVIAYAAHTARFEQQWLTPDLTGGRPWICTWKCALRLWPDAPSHSNQALRYWLWPVSTMPGAPMRTIAAVAHRAFPDAYVTAHLLLAMLRGAPLRDLTRWSAEPCLLVRVPFGRDTKGMKWAEVDDDFLGWVLARDFDEDVLFTAKHEVERREKLAELDGEARP